MIVYLLSELLFKGTTHELYIYRGTWKGEYIIICRQLDEFSLVFMGEQILKYILNFIGLKVRIVAEESTMKSVNCDDIDQTIIYVKNHCGMFIR